MARATWFKGVAHHTKGWTVLWWVRSAMCHRVMRCQTYRCPCNRCHCLHPIHKLCNRCHWAKLLWNITTSIGYWQSLGVWCHSIITLWQRCMPDALLSSVLAHQRLERQQLSRLPFLWPVRYYIHCIIIVYIRIYVMNFELGLNCNCLGM